MLCALAHIGGFIGENQYVVREANEAAQALHGTGYLSQANLVKFITLKKAVARRPSLCSVAS